MWLAYPRVLAEVPSHGVSLGSLGQQRRLLSSRLLSSLVFSELLLLVICKPVRPRKLTQLPLDHAAAGKQQVAAAHGLHWVCSVCVRVSGEFARGLV